MARKKATFTVVSLPRHACKPVSTVEKVQTFEFALGDLRGGAASPLGNTIPRSSRRIRPLFDIGRAAETAQRGLHIVKIHGDGRCLFRALTKGLVHNRGGHISGKRETDAADELRMAVYDALCRDEARAKAFEEVNYSVENLEGGKTAYCRRLRSEGFWGGELEILVLSKMLHVPIYVYRTAEEAGMNKHGFVPIVKYGEQWAQQGVTGPGRKPVHLLYGNGNHYDVLL